jgi:hypothetical protein
MLIESGHVEVLLGEDPAVVRRPAGGTAALFQLAKRVRGGTRRHFGSIGDGGPVEAACLNIQGRAPAVLAASSPQVKALVTGAGGFVGANLAATLAHEGHDVVAWVHPGSPTWRLHPLADAVEVRPVELLDGEAIEVGVGSARPDWIFDLAAHGAYSWQRDAERIMQTNLVSTVRLLNACQRHGFSAFVNAGSSSEYGFQDHAPERMNFPSRTATTRS